MYKKYLNRIILYISLAVLLLPLSLSIYASEINKDHIEQNRAQQLLQQYHQQQQRITSIQNAQQDLSTLEQASVDYRLFEHYLSAFETLDKLAQYLIKQDALSDEWLSVKAEFEKIIQHNSQRLQATLVQQQQNFSKKYAEIEKYSTESLSLYIEHLAIQDKIYQAITQQVLNQQALGLDVSNTKEYLVDKLYNRAEAFAGMVGLVVKKRKELNTLINLVAENQSLKDQLSVVSEKLVVARGSFNLTITLLKKLNFDTALYQQALLKIGGQLTTDILNVSLLSDLISRTMGVITRFFADHAGEWFFKILLIGAIYYIFRTLSRLASKVITKSLESKNVKLSALMKKMIVSSVRRTIMILGVLIALSQVGISLAPILAGLGVAGFIIGFALQDTLSNFAAGMMILFYRPYDVGDMVEVSGGVFGKVNSMNLVSTTILTIDNQTLVIPNSKIWGDVIKNVTAQKIRRVDLVFGIGYSDDIAKTEALLNDILLAHPLVLKYPEPAVKLHVLNESSVDFVVRPWVKTDDYWDVYWDLTREVKIRFDKDGISIPFPQRDVHLYPATASSD